MERVSAEFRRSEQRERELTDAFALARPVRAPFPRARALLPLPLPPLPALTRLATSDADGADSNVPSSLASWYFANVRRRRQAPRQHQGRPRDRLRHLLRCCKGGEP